VDTRPALEPGGAGAWHETRVAEPEVVRTADGHWTMWFTGIGPDGAAIGRATSPDGVTWTHESEPVLGGAEGWTAGEVDGPQVVPVDGGYLMAYSAAPRGRFEVGLAFSADGIGWQPWPGNPVLDQTDLPEDAGLFQAALVSDGDEIVLLQESGPGASHTVVHAVRVDATAARDAQLPVVEADALVDGDRVSITVDVPSLELAFDPGDDPEALHPHVYVDIPPPPPGSTIPAEAPAVVHAEAGPVEVTGLTPGGHDLWVVMADGREVVARLPGAVRVRVTIP
jgi:hypothetical protein